MQRIDGYYLYTVGSQIHPLSELKASTPSTRGTTQVDAFLPLIIAEGALEPFLTRSVFHLRTSYQAGHALLSAIKDLQAKIMAETDASKVIDFSDVYSITSKLTAFEAVLGAELALMPLYVVQPKAGYDTAALVETGSVCFPYDLGSKVPHAVFLIFSKALDA